MNKRLLKNTLITAIVILLNLVTFLYFLADSNMTSPLLREVLFAALFGVLSVFFGYLTKRWWLVFLGGAGVLLLGIRAIFLIGGISDQWLRDFTAFLLPIVTMEVAAFTGSLGKKIKSNSLKQLTAPWVKEGKLEMTMKKFIYEELWILTGILFGVLDGTILEYLIVIKGGLMVSRYYIYITTMIIGFAFGFWAGPFFWKKIYVEGIRGDKYVAKK